jgi:hypothetical protein
MTPTQKKYERNVGKLFQVVLNKDYKWYNKDNHSHPSDETIYFISGLRRRARRMYVYDVMPLGEKDTVRITNTIRSVPAIDVDSWITGKVHAANRKNDYWAYVEYKHT